MTRYLTPAKIGLLALIELYTESAVPTGSSVAILSFIVAQLLPSSRFKPHNNVSDDDTAHGNSKFNISIDDFEKLLSRTPASTGLPGRSLYDLLLEKFWAINSLDGLHLFFRRRAYMLIRSKEDVRREGNVGLPPPTSRILLSRTSPFGAFVRRAQLEFERLKFHDALALYKSFIAYRQPTLLRWNLIKPCDSPWRFDQVLQAGDPNWNEDQLKDFYSIAYDSLLDSEPSLEGQVSTDDVEKLLEFQVEQMQKLGTRVPDDVRGQFKSLIGRNVLIPSLSHYANFLDSWRAGDYSGSFDNLHRFFDYTMQSRDRLFYQYALLNLAVLQADFGCFHEAVAAMQETVSTARENKDMSCLNFSLSWLYHFSKAHPQVLRETGHNDMLGVERESLAFLRVKAKECGMWSLWSSALLSEAKMGLSNGESVATAFENILRSSELTVTKGMMSSIGAQLQLQAALWHRLGIAHLTWSYCEIFLQCHARYAACDDVVRLTCRSSYLLMQRGRYTEALQKIENLDEKELRSLKVNQYWLLFRGILKLKYDVQRNDLDGAERLLSQLLQSKVGDREIAFELSMLHTEVMMRRGNYAGALANIEKTADDTHDDIYYRARLLTMKASLFDKCGRPQKGFSLAMQAASIAWRARLLPALWQAMGSLACILISLCEFSAAAQILNSVLPRALECEDLALAAQLYSHSADAFMGMAADPRKRTQNLTKALGFLDRALAGYSTVHDIKAEAEMMAKKAVVMRLMGDIPIANNYAAAYLDLVQPVSI